MMETVGLIAGIILPLWNIPLIVRIVRRKSSQDISMWWAMGVWACILLMAPSGIRLDSLAWRTFNYLNVVLFTGVAVTVLIYRRPKGEPRERSAE
ncbi:MAG: hypothetical protein ACLFPX_07960 [Candidatus Omnitrophota bacterium]